MKFYHRTTEERWKVIQEREELFGVAPGWDGWQIAHKDLDSEPKRMRYTYLSPISIDWGENFGFDREKRTVLLEVEYDPKPEDASIHCGGTIKKRERPIKHNYNFNPPKGKICDQFSVFEPIPLTNIKRIK